MLVSALLGHERRARCVRSCKCFLGGRPAFSGSQTVLQATLLFHRKEKRVGVPSPSPPLAGPIWHIMASLECRRNTSPWPWPPSCSCSWPWPRRLRSRRRSKFNQPTQRTATQSEPSLQKKNGVRAGVPACRENLKRTLSIQHRGHTHGMNTCVLSAVRFGTPVLGLGPLIIGRDLQILL